MTSIINKANWKIADNYIMQYKLMIESIFPQLDGKTIEICESKDYHNQVIIDHDSPTQMVLKDEDPELNNDTIFFVRDYRNNTDSIEKDFTEKELFALISHELGHLATYYRNEDSNDEILADDCATKLGLKDAMLTAVRKLLKHYDNSPDRKFDCINDPQKQKRRKYEERIIALSNP